MRPILLLAFLAWATLPASAQYEPSIGPLTKTASAWPRPEHAGPEDMLRGGPPYNDLCENAVIHPLALDGSVTITGDNTGSTDTESFGNPVSWEAFSLTTCATISVNYCGTDPLFEWVYSILITGCPDFVASVQNNGTGTCDDGNAYSTFENLPAGTYYIPVLRMAGATGPYTITVSASPCDLPPPNDVCADAEQIPVLVDCTGGMTVGVNANTVTDGQPWCAISQAGIQDVWYGFNSGTATEVVITIAPGTIGDIGVEVLETCEGPSIFCSTGATEYTVGITPDTGYRVRVFSNNDLGLGGTFSICVSVPPGACEASAPVAPGGGAEVITCVNGEPIVFTGEGIADSLLFVLTDTLGGIVSVTDTTEIPVDGLPPGSYQLWGVSYNGALTGTEPGQPLEGLAVQEGCLDVSDAPLAVVVEVCMSAPEPGDVLPVRWDGAASLVWLGPPQHLVLDLVDARGGLVFHGSVQAFPGQPVLRTDELELTAGVYVARAISEEGTLQCTRLLVR